MNLKKLRLEKGWSQEHIAEISGLSVRTIQRIEKNKKAVIQSLNLLASAFDISISELTNELDYKEQDNMKQDSMVNRVIGKGLSKRNRELVIHILIYLVTMFGFYAVFSLFLGLNFITWIVGVAWGVAVGFHGVSLFIPMKQGI